jgi:histidine kinase
MPWYKRLRWRLIASQFWVALVGVTIMMLATRLIILSTAADVIRPRLLALLQDPSLLAQTELDLILAFRNAVLLSVLVAATGAIVAGVVSSLVLRRTLISPLRLMAGSSRRIAQGRYGERVSVLDNSGETMAELVSNFNQMAESLQEVEKQRVTLLANISHELRTPLAGLKGYLEGLLDGLFANTEETVGWMLREVDRLSRLIEDIQKLSRVEAGQIDLHMETFDICEVARRVRAQLLPQAQAKGVTLKLGLPASPVQAHADPDRTAQIMINLASNALRYTPEEGRISIQVQPETRGIRVTVEDTGIGIPADALPYIFERFYRVDQSRARSSGGSGIGLTIARYFAWAMGGELTASSPGVGQGSSFTLVLPLASPAANPSQT